jgi:hypothetical protein
MRRLAAEVYRRDPVLALAGWLQVALLAGMLLAAAIDERQVLGLNVWIKPIKFAASIAIYLWTLAWLLEYLPDCKRCKSLIRWGSTIAMLVEIICIAGQAARGTASHLNNSTAFDANVFTTMGLFILFNTLLDVLLAALFFRHNISLPPAYLWGIRLGLIGAVLSAVVGGVMIHHGSHTVGASDGGPGLWLVNWSTRAGDLRVSHALGLHALQLLPLAGYALSRLASPAVSLRALVAVALVYGAVTGWLFWRAIEGSPLVAGKDPRSPAVNSAEISAFSPEK